MKNSLAESNASSSGRTRKTNDELHTNRNTSGSSGSKKSGKYVRNSMRRILTPKNVAESEE